MPDSRNRSRGTALLAVLWLTAALSAIAFSIADTVRAETERGIAMQESTRAYYLARGGVERVMFEIRNRTDGSAGSTPAERYAARRRFYFQEEAGDTLVELHSERGKLPLRSLNPQVLQNLLLVLGENPASASAIVTQAFATNPIQFAQTRQNFAAASSFRPTFASMENVEELLLMPGITSELVYGRYSRMPDGNLVNLGGLSDFLSPHLVADTNLDPFSVHPSLLVAKGMAPAAARQFQQLRRSILDPSVALLNMMRFAQSNGAALAPDLGDVFEVKATSRVRLPNGELASTRRTVSLLVKFFQPDRRYWWLSPWTHLRWYDQAFSDLGSSSAVWMTKFRPEMKQ